MSETPSSPTSPAVEIPTPTPTDSTTNKFEGDGLVFKGKLIGVEQLSVDRDEKICLDSMFKLKAVVRARGEHKQKIQLVLTMTAVKIIDEATKKPVVSHEIERISFVVNDPRDARAFGYIFNTTDDHHQFWAIKTEKQAALTVRALKDLFDVVFTQFTNTEKAKLEAKKSTIPTLISPSNETVPSEQSPSTNNTVNSTVPSTTSPVNSAPPSLLDDLFGANPPPVPTIQTPPTTAATTTPSQFNLLDMDAPIVAPLQPPPKPIDSLDDFFGDLTLTTTTTNTNNTFSNPLSNIPPLTVNNHFNFPPQTTTTIPTMNFVNPNLNLPQQPYMARTAPPPPAPIKQQEFSIARPTVAPISTNPFEDFNIFGDFSSGTTTTATKTTKEAFFPQGPPPKTIQQLQMEKQRNALNWGT